jgi:polyisoprenoid-binding protein YceI
MKIKFSLVILLVLVGQMMFAQGKYITRSGHISFYSDAKLEKIEAHNYKVTAAIAAAGDMEFSVNMVGFEFEKSLMQDHFNENYVESTKFPKATFKGKITDIAKVSFTTDGTYNVNVAGKLTIHGVTKDVKTTGTITVKGGKINANSTFNIALSDYGVKVPGDKANSISNSIKIKVDLKDLKAM